MKYEQLLEKFNKEREQLHQENQPINLCAHQYLAFGLDCIEYFAHNYQIVLDGSIQSLAYLDEWIHQVYLTYQAEIFDLDPLAEMIAGYFSFLLDEQYQGNWVYDDEQEAYEINTHHFYLKDEVKRMMMEDKKISSLIEEINNYLI